MQQFIYFISKYRYLLFFFLLECVAIGLIINNYRFGKDKFGNSSNSVIGAIYREASEISDYLNLKPQNKTLVEENIRLKRRLKKISFVVENPSNFTVNDSVRFGQKYTYTTAKVIKNDFSKLYNFITLDGGKSTGITSEMAVINGKGILGITDVVSNHYTRVQSILNKNSKINARLKNSFYFGTLIWDGKYSNIVQLVDIPRQVIVKKGDSIITGGMSTIFPEGIPIGTVVDSHKKSGQIRVINIRLFNDMRNLGYVYIVKNLQKREIRRLEKGFKDE